MKSAIGFAVAPYLAWLRFVAAAAPVALLAVAAVIDSRTIDCWSERFGVCRRADS